tara:strand:- start:1312 stop:1659 length:348 start_codon:yes stop_codon:yes gene_type:complete
MKTHINHSNFKPTILHQNEVGQISQCEECGEITILIKSIMFFCNVGMLKDIRKMISSITSRIDDHIFIVNDEQKVVLCTIHENVKLCFTIEEMLELNELLDQSLHMIEVNKLLMN